MKGVPVTGVNENMKQVWSMAKCLYVKQIVHVKCLCTETGLCNLTHHICVTEGTNPSGSEGAGMQPSPNQSAEVLQTVCFILFCQSSVIFYSYDNYSSRIQTQKQISEQTSSVWLVSHAL